MNKFHDRTLKKALAPVGFVERVGLAELRLCRGRIPHYKEMVSLAGPLLEYMVEELGTSEVVRRFSDPFWYQALAVALGFEWQFCGATTVPIMAIQDALRNKDIGISFLGGKGSKARIADSLPRKLARVSRLTCKVDNNAIQAGYQLYFHVLITDGKVWTVINQGMNESVGLVRRYHWFSTNNFLDEPHSGSVGIRGIALNLASRDSRETRSTIIDIVRDENPFRIARKILTLRKAGSGKFASIDGEIVEIPPELRIPSRISIRAIQLAKEVENFEELLLVPGMGPATIRGLAFLANLVYGSPISWKDPVKYSFAFGTKAGVPWFVEKKNMLKAAEFFRRAVEELKVGRRSKRKALIRLSRLVEKAFKPDHV